RDGPKEPRVALMSRTLLPPHFMGDLKKQMRESERKTSPRRKKWRSGYREATVNKEEAGDDSERRCRLNTI
ncbi:unnamed protein product, partial [Brassica rapa subsp. trilocularis]